ncbi:MAG TPA: hypothetical protein PKA05_07035 [Roseiflexaceae bacterium]|nr:hypothetical protein [Roseiflexaceae bacterium]HMP40118.1 hypothetical protein [Roseiflexaceae bacterium]
MTSTIDRIAAALINDLQALAHQQPAIESLSDLRTVLSHTAAAGATATQAVAQRSESAGKQDTERRAAIGTALSVDVQQQIVRVRAAAERPTITPRAGFRMVTGRISDKKNGLGLPNVAIDVYDLDRKHDDLLGRTYTDDYGYYQLEYTAQDVDDPDGKAEIYLKILDDEGTVVHQTPRSFHEKAGELHELDVAINATKLPANRHMATAVAERLADDIARYEQQLNLLRRIGEPVSGKPTP